MLRDSVCPRLSVLTHPKRLVRLFWRKPLTTSGPNAEKCRSDMQIWTWITALTRLPVRSVRMGDDLAREKPRGALLRKIACQVRMMMGFSCSLIPREGACSSPGRGSQRVPEGGSSSSPDNTLHHKPRHLLGMLPGMCRGSLHTCAPEEPGNVVITNSLILPPAAGGKNGLVFSRSKSDLIRKDSSDKTPHWLQLPVPLEAQHSVQVLVLSPVKVRDEFEPVILWLVFTLRMNCNTDLVETAS